MLPQDISPTAPTANNTSPSLIESSPDTPATDTRKNKSYDNIENNNDRPDDDDDDDDDDVDCFPRQDKQPVLPQDISPTAPTATATANNTSPSLIEMNNYNYKYNRRRNTKRTKTKTKPTHTILPEAPLLVWDGTQYQLDYTHNHRPSVSVWDGTTHTDIVYDDYDCCTDDYAYGDSCNMNDSSVRSQFQQSLQTVQFQNRLQAEQHIDTTPKHTQTIPQASPQQQQQSKHTTIKRTHEDPKPYMYDTLQLLFLTTHYKSADNYTDQFPLYTVPHYITRKKKHPSHDNYLYRRWNNPTTHTHKTKKTRTKCLLVTKDDTSVAPTLKILCTTDTRSSHQTTIAPNTILNVTIWNKTLVQYRMPIRSLAPTRNRSRHPSTAVRYALIGVHDKPLNPPKLPCPLFLLTSIICVVLSCFILLADSFTLVKIDDRYPDEWFD